MTTAEAIALLRGYASYSEERAAIDSLEAENAALREAGEGLYRQWMGLGYIRATALARWREVVGEPDPIIPGYGSSIDDDLPHDPPLNEMGC